MERYQVVELAVDPPGWASEIDAWREQYGDVVVEFPTNSRGRMAPASTDSGPVSSRAASRTPAIRSSPATSATRSRKSTPAGVIITKAHPDNPHKIDAAVAAVVAYDRASWHAANEPPESPRPLVAWV